jgi:hypothetical protein
LWRETFLCGWSTPQLELDDTETPDLWDELRRETELLTGISDEAFENTPFTPNEHNEIVRQLNQVREHARNAYALSEPQLTDPDLKLDYLVDAANRLGRKDWINLCVGTMFGWLLVAAIPPEASHHIFLMLMSGLAHFIVRGIPGLGSG